MAIYARWFAVIGAFRSSLLFRLTDDVPSKVRFVVRNRGNRESDARQDKRTRQRYTACSYTNLLICWLVAAVNQIINVLNAVIKE